MLISLPHFPCAVAVPKDFKWCVCMYTSLLRSLLHINSCTVLQASCLIAPPLPFFSALNEALSVHHCGA